MRLQGLRRIKFSPVFLRRDVSLNILVLQAAKQRLYTEFLYSNADETNVTTEGLGNKRKL